MKRDAQLISVAIAFVIVAGGTGCGPASTDGGCSNDLECRSPRVCVNRVCQSPPGGGSGAGGGGGGGGGGGASAGGGSGSGGGVAIGGGGGSTSPRSKHLAVPGIPQMTQVWCWAACSEMVIAFVRQDVPQCVILSKWYGANCCANFNACATAAPTNVIQNTILFEAGLTSTLVQRPLTWAEFVAEIDRGFPVIMGYQGSFAGHVVVGYGYDEADQTVDIHDPYYGTFRVPFVTSFSYHGGGGTLRWVSTIAEFGRYPAFCCTQNGKLGPYPNGTIPAGGSCFGTDSGGYQWPGTACF